MLCVLIAVGVSLLPDQPSEWSELGIHTHIHNHPCIYTHINIFISLSLSILKSISSHCLHLNYCRNKPHQTLLLEDTTVLLGFLGP